MALYLELYNVSVLPAPFVSLGNANDGKGEIEPNQRVRVGINTPGIILRVSVRETHAYRY